MITGIYCTHHLSGAVLNAYCELIHLIRTTNLQDMYYYHPYFIVKLTEAHKCYVTCLR